MKVLLISYFFEPYSTVAVKRTSYWFANFHKYEIDVDVITAIAQDAVNEKIKYVPMRPTSSILGSVVKDPGVHWKKNLKDFFRNTRSNFNYEVVIITGGPFLHFGIGKFLKKEFGCKIILDYRDPFAKNKRFNDGLLKRTLKTYLEKKYNKNADAILTVNEICKMDLSYNHKVSVVPNGYDDTSKELSSNETVSVEKGLLINGGKLHPEFDESSLINVILNNDKLRFEQVGKKYEHLDSLDQDRITTIGFVSYDELIRKIRKAEVTILMTAGQPFETPTKVYDYIALNKKILIITEGELNSGGIQGMIRDYPNAVWSKNSPEDISEAIKKLQSLPDEKFDASLYSRAHSLMILVELIKKLS